MDETLKRELGVQLRGLEALADSEAFAGRLSMAAVLLGARQTIRVLVANLEKTATVEREIRVDGIVKDPRDVSL